MKIPNLPIINKPQLDELYTTYNSRKWVHPDPLEYLYAYTDFKDREVIGMIASSLAYGRVAQILKSVAWVIEKLGPFPHVFLECSTPAYLKRVFHGFKHRFTTAEELAIMLNGVKNVIARYGPDLKICKLNPKRKVLFHVWG